MNSDPAPIVQTEADAIVQRLSYDARLILECAMMLGGISQMHGVPEIIVDELTSSKCMESAAAGGFDVTPVGAAVADKIRERQHLIRVALGEKT